MPRSADKAPDTRLDAVQIAYPFSVQHAGSVQVSRLISLLLSAVVNAGGLLPVSHAVLCSLDMSDRHNTEIRAVSVDSDWDWVETPFTASGTRISIAQGTVAHSGRSGKMCKR